MSANFRPSRIGTSIAGSAVTPGAMSRPVGEIKDDTIVTMGGQQMSAEIASSLGFLKKVGDNYVDVNAPVTAESSPAVHSQAGLKGSRQVNSENTNVNANNSNVLLDIDTESAIESYYDTIGESAVEELLAEVVNNGTVTESTIVKPFLVM